MNVLEMNERVLNTIYKKDCNNPHCKITHFEIAEELGIDANEIWSCMKDLVNEGYLEECYRSGTDPYIVTMTNKGRRYCIERGFQFSPDDIEAQKYRVLKILYDSRHELFAEPEIPVSLRLLSEKTGINVNRLKEICSVLKREKLITIEEKASEWFVNIQIASMDKVEDILHKGFPRKELIDEESLSIINKKQIVPIYPALKIMISSTIDDLKPERRIIEEIATNMGFTVLRSETLSAPGKSSLEVCEKMAKECDLYVGILGARYGAEFDEIGTSVVEFEYNVAKDDDKSKVMIYIKDVPERDQKQQEFIKRVEDFTQGIFRHPYFKSVEELGEYFKRDLDTWITERVRRKKQEAKTYKKSMVLFGVKWDLSLTEDLREIEISDPYCAKCGMKLLNYDMWIEKFPYPKSQIKAKPFSWYCEKCDEFIDHPVKMGLSYIKYYIIESIKGGFRKGTNYIDKEKEELHIECEGYVGWASNYIKDTSQDNNK